jgi:putative transposase
VGIIGHSSKEAGMKKTRYTEEQIVSILKEGEAGVAVSELCRKYGISDATYYNWKAKYSGMTASDVKRLKHLEDENRRLKHLVADLTLDNQALKEVISKNF